MISYKILQIIKVYRHFQLKNIIRQFFNNKTKNYLCKWTKIKMENYYDVDSFRCSINAFCKQVKKTKSIRNQTAESNVIK